MSPIWHASRLPQPPPQYTLSLTTCIKYCPYPFFNIGWAWRSSCSALIQPARKAISSGQATFRPWRFSSVACELPRLHQAVVRARVQPGITAAHDLHAQLLLVQVALVASSVLPQAMACKPFF